MPSNLLALLPVVFGLLCASPVYAQGGGSATTLGNLIQKSNHIGLYELVSIDEPGTKLVYKLLANLKGNSASVTLEHHFADPSEEDKKRLQALRTGNLALCFTGSQVTVCLGEAWYWTGLNRPAADANGCFCRDYSQTFYGPVQLLRDRVDAILQGKEVVVPAAYLPPNSSHDVFDLFTQNDPLPGGRERIWRVKASLRIADLESIHAESPHFVGWGVGGPEIVSELLGRLDDKESKVRAAAALDLEQINPAPREALAPLHKALEDKEPLVRISAAHALSRIDPLDPSPVNVLIEQLHQENEELQTDAIWALSQFRSKASAALPHLLQISEKQYAPPHNYLSPYYAMGKIGSDLSTPSPFKREIAASFNRAMIRSSENPREEDKLNHLRIYTLLQLGPEARFALPGIQACAKNDWLVNKNWIETQLAVGLICRMGPAGLEVFDQLIRDDVTPLIYFAGDMGSDARFMIPSIIGFLKSKHPGERFGAAKALLKLDSKIAVRIIIPVLRALLEDKKNLHKYPHLDVLLSLIDELGPAAQPLVGSLISQLDGDINQDVVHILGRIGPGAQNALPALRQILQEAQFGSSAYSTVSDAALAIWQIDKDPRAIESLYEIIRSRRIESPIPTESDSIVGLFHPNDFWHQEQRNEFEALGQMGPRGHEALLRLVKDKSFSKWSRLAKMLAANALAQVDRNDPVSSTHSILRALAAIEELYQHGPVSWRIAACRACAQLGIDARPAIPTLVTALRDTDLIVRNQALLALAKMGPTAKEAIPAVVEMLKLTEEDQVSDRTRRYRIQELSIVAAATLWRIQPGNTAIIPFLLDRLEKHPETTLLELEALESMAPAAKPAVPALRRLVLSGRPYIFRHALHTLRAIDPLAAEEAWPTKDLGDPKPFPPPSLTSSVLESAWNDLAIDDEITSTRAIWQLIFTPHSAVPFLESKMRPVTSAPENQVKQWIRDLDAGDFNLRASSMAALEKLEDVAEPMLQATLAQNPSLEVRRRIQTLRELNDPQKSPNLRRRLHAVEVLEESRTPDARRVLQKLATGDASASQTRAAKAALERLGKLNVGVGSK